MIRSLPIYMLLLLLTLVSPAVAAQLRLPGELPLELPEGFDLPLDLQTIALGADGALAFAVPREHNGRIGSTVEILNKGIGGTRIDLDLRIRDLIWISDGRLLGIGFRAARRTQGEAFLLVWDPARDRFKRLMRLPPSARDLAYGNRPDLLLLTVRDELRTIRLPLLRSGSLFRVLGDNRSVTVVQGNRVLVGQSEALLLVDLDDRQSREQMPFRERVEVGSPVEQLSTATDGRGALAGMLDGSIQRVLLDPLRLEDDGEGKLVSAFLGVSPDEQVPVVTSTPKPVKDQVRQPAATQNSVELEPAKPADEPLPVDDEQFDLAEEPIAKEDPAEPEETPIHGRLTGPGRSAVRAVVAFGPNSVLREAARIVPSEDGSFNFNTLPEGRYRIQLDGGGGKVLVSEPAVHIIDLKADSELRIQFRVLQAL